MRTFPKLRLIALALPLTLALAGCTDGVTSGEASGAFTSSASRAVGSACWRCRARWASSAA